jgi:hypothetical protein
LAGAVALALVLGATGLYAQVDTGTILGTVKDQSGAVVPGARVTITNEGTGFTISKTTAVDGSYLFTPIKIGLYTVTTEYQGFRTEERLHITVDIQQQVLVNFSLSPGMVTQKIEVTTPPPLLETQSGSLGQVIESKQISDLPLNGRNFTFLAQLSAGVMPNYIGGAAASGTLTGGLFIANGFRFEQDNFMLDGLDNNNKMTGYGYTGPTVALPPVDAIQEFKLQSNAYSAQFGRSAGSQMNATTKSGTNRIHGDLWEFVRNNHLDSADYFQDAAGIAKNNKLQRNQFGGAVGGPVYLPHIYNGRNKTFFFFDYEGTRVRQAVPIITSVPTVAEASSGYTNYADLVTGESGALYGPDALGRKYAIGTIMDPATTRGPFSAGQVDPVTGLTFTSSCSACYVRDPFGWTPTTPLGTNIMPLSRIFTGAAKIAAMDPLPNIGGTAIANNYAANLPLTTNNDLYDIRVDQNFSSRDQFFARYSHFHSPQMSPNTNGGDVTDMTTITSDMHSGVAGWTHTFTPTLINEARAGYSRLHGTTLQQNATNYGLPAALGIPGIPQGNENGGVPAMLVSTASATLWLGNETQTPDLEFSETTQVSDNLTKIYGKHTLKAGFMYMHMAFPFTTDTFGRGRWRFNGNYTSIVGIGDSSTGWANFLLQPIPSMLPSGDSGVDYSGGSTGITISNVTPIATSQGLYGFYFQDDWKVTPKLTLNLGIRDEYYAPYVDKFGNMANIVPNLGWQGGQFLLPARTANTPLSTSFATALATDGIKVVSDSNPALVSTSATNWGPRFGFAYSATPKLVVRGGFGMFYGGADNQGNAWNIALNYPFLYTLSYSPPNTVQPILPGAAVGALSNGFNNVGLTSTTVLASAVSPRGVQPNYSIPTAYEGNLTLQYQLTPNTVAGIGYVETSGRHLDTQTEANLANVLLPPTTSNLLPYLPFPDIARGFGYATTQADSYYNAMQINFEKRFSGGLNFLANYTYSKCRDDGGGLLYGETESYYRAAYVPGFGIQYDYALCDWDTTNIVHFSGSWSLPVGAGRRFLGSMHGVGNAILGGWQTNWIFNWYSGEPTTLHSTISTDAGQGASTNLLLLPGQNKDAGQSIAHYWNAAAFTNPPLVTSVGETNGAPLGGTPDQVYGPPVHRMDFSLFKQFHITERSYLEFRGEFFNFTNTPDFAMPSATNYQNTTTFGVITSTRDSPNDARQIQLALKLYF